MKIWTVEMIEPGDETFLIIGHFSTLERAKKCANARTEKKLAWTEYEAISGPQYRAESENSWVGEDVWLLSEYELDPR